MKPAFGSALGNILVGCFLPVTTHLGRHWSAWAWAAVGVGVSCRSGGVTCPHPLCLSYRGTGWRRCDCRCALTGRSALGRSPPGGAADAGGGTADADSADDDAAGHGDAAGDGGPAAAAGHDGRWQSSVRRWQSCGGQR